MSQVGGVWQGCWGQGTGWLAGSGWCRITSCLIIAPDTGPPCRSRGVGAGHACRAREGPGGAPAAQTPSALGRWARSAACRSSARTGWLLSDCLGASRGSCCARGPRPRKCARWRVCAHRHGRVELFVVDLGLDRFYLRLVQLLGARVGGRHLVQWNHVN